MHPQWLSNAYLVADRPGGTALFVDSGAPLEPLLAAVDELELTVTHLLTTHAHGDHTAGDHLLGSLFELQVAPRPTGPANEPFRAGGLEIVALPTPGHSADSLSFVVSEGEEDLCFTGDTLFSGSVGGTSPGEGFSQLRGSIMEVLLALPPGTTVLPGHSGETSVGRELEQNPFVRIWRGLDPEDESRCSVGGREARLVLWARDYDDGFKAWVRFDGDIEQIVGGSRVRRLTSGD